MKYYTGVGDKGKTSIAGKRVRKDSNIINAIGDVDEVNASLGHAYSFINDEEVKGILKDLERCLYVVGSELSGYIRVVKSKVKPIDGEDLSRLEQTIESISKRIEPMQKFIYPNGSAGATAINVSRAMARRAERSIIKANVKDEPLLRYMNRLSSLLFVLVRYVNKLEKTEEEYF